jgi:hypothetical protein
MKTENPSMNTFGKSNVSSLAYSLTSNTFKLTESDYQKGALDSSKEGTMKDSLQDEPATFNP